MCAKIFQFGLVKLNKKIKVIGKFIDCSVNKLKFVGSCDSGGRVGYNWLVV